MAALGGIKILVIDDETEIRDILRDELEFCGALVSEASGGIEALATVRARHPTHPALFY